MSHDKGSKTTLTVKTPQSQYDVNVARVKKGEGFETTCTVGTIFDMKLEEKITMGPPAGMFINSNLSKRYFCEEKKPSPTFQMSHLC